MCRDMLTNTPTWWKSYCSAVGGIRRCMLVKNAAIVEEILAIDGMYATAMCEEANDSTKTCVASPCLSRS